ncbi:hypothetical protein B0H12DRAFT_1076464 [Mycena haematopus]|nr:hypothetical protein B0H12DRAFT_1076464 [Mycena haematopus]
MLGLAAVALFLWILMFCLLLGDARRFVGRVMSARAAPPSGPISLEDGSAVPTSSTADAASAPAPPAAKDMPPALKLLSILSSTVYLVFHSLTTDVISLHRPLLENVGAAVKYVLQGCEVLFALFLVLVVIVGVKKQWRGEAAAEAPAPTLPAPVEAPVSVDVFVVEDDEKKALVEEKAGLHLSRVASHSVSHYESCCLDFFADKWMHSRVLVLVPLFPALARTLIAPACAVFSISNDSMSVRYSFPRCPDELESSDPSVSVNRSGTKDISSCGAATSKQDRVHLHSHHGTTLLDTRRSDFRARQFEHLVLNYVPRFGARFVPVADSSNRFSRDILLNPSLPALTYLRQPPLRPRLVDPQCRQRLGMSPSRLHTQDILRSGDLKLSQLLTRIMAHPSLLNSNFNGIICGLFGGVLFILVIMGVLRGCGASTHSPAPVQLPVSVEDNEKKAGLVYLKLGRHHFRVSVNRESERMHFASNVWL